MFYCLSTIRSNHNHITSLVSYQTAFTRPAITSLRLLYQKALDKSFTAVVGSDTIK